MGQQQQQEQSKENLLFQLVSYNDIEGPKQRRPKRRSSYVSQARRWVQVDRPKTQSMNPPMFLQTTSSASLQSSVINHHDLLTPLVTTQSRDVDNVEEKEDGGVCVICMDASSEAVCVPCGHVAGCVFCLKEIQYKNLGCPVCRASIDQVIKLYHV